MSRRRALAADPIVPADPPAAMRTCAAEPWPDEAATVRGLLREGIAVEFSLMPEDAAPWFTLRPFGDAVRVFDGAGGHVGTFGSVEAAVARGWERGGWGGMAEDGA